MARDHGFSGQAKVQESHFHFTVYAFLFLGPLFRQSVLIIYMTIVCSLCLGLSTPFMFQIKVEADLIPSQINFKSKPPLTNCWDYLSI